MEEPKQILTPEEVSRLAVMAEAELANEYLYQILEVGQTMLQCGGEVSRVEDSLRRLCFSFGAERADVLTITASIVVTVSSHRFGAITQTRRIEGMKYDLNRLELLNQLCRLVCSEHLGPEDMHAALEEIMSVPQYSFGVQLFTYVLISSSFSLFFGGSVLDAAASGVIGILLKYLERMIRTAKVIEVKDTADAVGLFDRVTIYNEMAKKEMEVRIVTTLRQDALKWLVSKESPVGKAILGRRAGERAEVVVSPTVKYFVEIRKIEKGEDDESLDISAY